MADCHSTRKATEPYSCGDEVYYAQLLPDFYQMPRRNTRTPWPLLLCVFLAACLVFTFHCGAAGKHTSGYLNSLGQRVSIPRYVKPIAASYEGRDAENAKSILIDELLRIKQISIQTIKKEKKERETLQGILSKHSPEDAVPYELIVSAHRNLTEADRLLEKQNYAQAEYYLRSVQRALPPGHWLAGRAAIDLGLVLEARGQYEEASRLYRSLEAHPDEHTHQQATRLAHNLETLRYVRYANVGTKRPMSRSIRSLLQSFSNQGADAVIPEFHATAADLAFDKLVQRISYFVLSALFLVPIGIVAWLSQ